MKSMNTENVHAVQVKSVDTLSHSMCVQTVEWYSLYISHHQVLSPLFRRIEEESTEERDPHAITQDRQIGLCELERCRILVHHLPHAVQEKHEQRGLHQGNREKQTITTCISILANP